MATFSIREPSDLHIETLAQSVTDLDVSWTSHHLDLHTICAELVAWDFAKPQQSGFSLLVKDLEVSAANLLKNARRHIGQELPKLLAAASHIPADSRIIKRLAASIQHRCLMPEMCVAAWEDLVVAAEPARPLRELGVARMVFAAAAKCQGLDLDWSGLSSMLPDAVRGDLRMVTFLQHAAGSSHNSEVNAHERVELVSAFLRVVDRKVDNVVWVPLRQAMMGVPELRAAQLRFYRGVNMRASIDGKKWWALPSEIEANADVFDRSVTGKVDQLHDVLVRVPTPGVSMARAIPECLRTIEALLASMGKLSHPGWVVGSPVLHFVDGVLERTSLRRDPVVDPTSEQDWRLSPVYSNLYQWSTHMMNIHYRVTPEYDQTLEYVRSYNRLGVHTSLDRLSTSVRLIENVRVSAGSRDGWWTFTEKYLKDIWTWDHLVDDVFVTAERIGTERSIPDWIRSDSSEINIRQLLDHRDRLLSSRGPVRVDEMIDCLIRLRRNVDRDWLVARKINQVARLSSSDAAKRRAIIASAREVFDTLLSRLRRYRDYATHGAWVPREGAETVQHFATSLATMVANAHINSVTCGLELDSVLISGRDTARAKLESIEQSGTAF